MTTQAPTKVTRRVAMKTGLGTALSALNLSALHAGNPPHHPKEGSIAMSHHLDTPLAAQNGQLYIDDLYVFSGDGSTVFIMDVNSNITGAYQNQVSTQRRAMSLKCTSMEPISKP
jgi:hypothetical protein